VQVTGPTGVPNIYNSQANGPTLGFVALLNPAIGLTVSATNPSGAQAGSFSWVQLLNSEKVTVREGGPNSGAGLFQCIPSFFANDPAPELDTQYPAGTGYTFADSPHSTLLPPQTGDVLGEQQLSESFTTYLMWNPNLQGSIPVPLGSVIWQWACDGVNTLTPQTNGTTWVRGCAAPQNPGQAQFNPGSSYPNWRNVAPGGFTAYFCQNQ